MRYIRICIVVVILFALGIAVAGWLLKPASAGGSSEIRFWNRFKSVREPAFPIPEGWEPIENEDTWAYEIHNASQKDYETFASGLEEAGFSIWKTRGSGDCWIRDDCIVVFDFDEKDNKLTFSWYQKSPYAPQNGISYEEAQELLKGHSVVYSTYARLSSSGEQPDGLPLFSTHPIDVTPKDLYELTGGQVFAVAHAVPWMYNRAPLDIEWEDMKWHVHLYYLNGDEVIEFDRIAVCDMDEDGNEDVFLASDRTSECRPSIWRRDNPWSSEKSDMYHVRCLIGQQWYEASFGNDLHIGEENASDLEYNGIWREIPSVPDYKDLLPEKIGFSTKGGKLFVGDWRIGVEKFDGEKRIILYKNNTTAETIPFRKIENISFSEI